MPVWGLEVVCEPTLPRTCRIKFDAAGLNFAMVVILDVCDGCLDTDAELIAVSINSGLGGADHAAFDRGVYIRSQCHFLATTKTGQTSAIPMTSPFLQARHSQSELIQGRTRSVENSNPLPRLTTQKK